MVKALDGIQYWRDDFLSYTGPASDAFKEAEHRIENILSSSTYSGIYENYIVLALFLRETTYWFAREISEYCDCSSCPINIELKNKR